MQIAIDAGKREIVGIVSPAMNLRNDMLDVQWRPAASRPDAIDSIRRYGGRVREPGPASSLRPSMGRLSRDVKLAV